MIVGFDAREAIAYHVFCQSVLEKSSSPVAFIPLTTTAVEGYRETHVDGSNAFIYSRFLSPFIMDFKGWVIFADGDMVCQEDIAKLWSLRDESYAVIVVKHNYKTVARSKYLGNKNEDYPRKNWSSLILWNCEHPKNRLLNPDFVMNASGATLHRFTWLEDHEIGSLDNGWNWLATEFPDNYSAKIIHYTLGTPCFADYRKAEMADVWHEHLNRALTGLEYTVQE